MRSPQQNQIDSPLLPNHLSKICNLREWKNKFLKCLIYVFSYENELKTEELEKVKKEILDGSKDLRDKLEKVHKMKEEKNENIKECNK